MTSTVVFAERWLAHERKIEFAGLIHLKTQILRFSALKSRRVDAQGKCCPDRKRGIQIMVRHYPSSRLEPDPFPER